MELSIKKNQKGEMRGRCREQREGGICREPIAKGEGVAEYRLRVRKLSIYTCFFFSGGLSVRFDSIDFRLWKPKPNRTGTFL
jgi:hypothetical protein